MEVIIGIFSVIGIIYLVILNGWVLGDYYSEEFHDQLIDDIIFNLCVNRAGIVINDQCYEQLTIDLEEVEIEKGELLSWVKYKNQTIGCYFKGEKDILDSSELRIKSICNLDELVEKDWSGGNCVTKTNKRICEFF